MGEHAKGKMVETAEPSVSKPAAEGWFGPEGSKRFHYFGPDLRSLCGSWILWTNPVDVDLGWGVAIGPANGDCATCKKKLEKRAPVLDTADCPQSAPPAPDSDPDGGGV